MLRLLFLVLLAATPLATAQDRSFTARTICFSYVGDVKQVWVPAGKERGMSEVGLFTAVHSLPFAMRSTEGRAVFFRPSDEAETPYVPLASANLPESSEVLFVFLPSGNEEKPYRVVALPDDARNFPYGSVRLMNLSKEQVRIQMGEHSGPQAVALAPGKSTLVSEVRRVDNFNRYPVLAEYRTDKGYARFHNTAWRSIRDKRDLVLIYSDPATGRPRVRHYEDAKPADLDLDP